MLRRYSEYKNLFETQPQQNINMLRIFQMDYTWNRLCVTVIFLLNIFGISNGIKCYQCSALKFTRQVRNFSELLFISFLENKRNLQFHSGYIVIFLFKTTCPGSLLYDYPRGDFCRLIALSDGRVINQEVVTETLCTEASVRYTKGKIGQDFLDTSSRKKI